MILVSFLFIGCSKPDYKKEEKQTLIPSSPIKIELFISNAPALNEEAELKTIITSIAEINNVKAVLSLPPGLEYIGGELVWEGNLIIPSEEKEKHPLPPTDCTGEECEKLWKEYVYPTVKKEFKTKIKAVKEGNFMINAELDGATDILYISVQKDKGEIYETGFPRSCTNIYIDGKVVECASKCPPRCENINSQCICNK